jgi:hypothetical protein
VLAVLFEVVSATSFVALLMDKPLPAKATKATVSITFEGMPLPVRGLDCNHYQCINFQECVYKGLKLTSLVTRITIDFYAR